MKIHLIRTPEYEYENAEEIFKILKSYNGPLKFELSDYKFNKKIFDFLRYELYPDHNFKFKSETEKINFINKRGYALSWKELFSLCDFYRKKRKVNENDYVVLLTYRKNSLNWFSHCDENLNVFIHTGDWEKHFLKVSHIFPSAYQIIENILQSLMEIDLEKEQSKYVHMESKGCINDFCQDKRQIILKLRTADICEDCMKRISKSGIDTDLINQIFQIMEGLRAQFLFKKDIKRLTGPYTLTVDDEYNILIPQLGNKKIELEPLFATLYILFLLNPEGIKLRDLYKFKHLLKGIYLKLNVNINEETAEIRIKDLINPISNSFSQKKIKINKKIQNQLGQSLSEFYQITGKRGEPFKINLPQNHIDIRF